MSTLRNFVDRRPRLSAWLFLAIGMVAILIISAPKDGTLTPMNWAFLILATIGLAGLCAWIISWEDGAEDDDGEPAADVGPDPTSKSAPKKDRPA
jgi:hypothetical protein